MKALIVDDNQVSSKILKSLLDPHAEVEIAVSGTEAHQRILASRKANEPFSVVFLDIMLPDGDGHSVLKEIRADEQERGIVEADALKVIMISALDDQENVVSAFTFGCEGYLVKPVVKSELEYTLTRLRLIAEN